MRPKGNRLETSTSRNAMRPRRRGRIHVSACTVSPGPTCTTPAATGSANRSHPSVSPSGRSRIETPNALHTRDSFAIS